MSARSWASTAAAQGKGVSHYHSSPPSHPLASPDTRTTTTTGTGADRELLLWSTSSDINDRNLISWPQNSRHLDSEVVDVTDNSPSTLKRLSGICESSSLDSGSAEFDGDISIVAPLGQEENTDLYSLQSWPIQIPATSKENKFNFSGVLKTNSVIQTDTDTNRTQAPLDLQEPSFETIVSKESSPTSPVNSRPILKTLYLTQPRNHQQSHTRTKSQEIDITRTKSYSPKPVDIPLLSGSRQSQPSVSKQAKDRAVWDEKVELRHSSRTRRYSGSCSEETPRRRTTTISSSCPPRMATSLEDITSLRLWKGIVAEFVGTLLLTLVGCGSCINMRGDTNVTSPVVQIALCFGLSVATVVWAIAHVSGGHVNPAVTCAMLATRKISLVKAVLFIVFQLVGAVVGAGILYGLTPQDYVGNLGCTLVNDKITPVQGLGVELFVTFVLVFTVFASCDGKRKDLNGSAPLTIGLSVTMCHLWAIDYTGSSMNTARSFGPALIKGNWNDHWVYWAGPIVGGVVAGLLYEHLFAMNASITKVKACMLSSDYDDEKYRARKLKVRIIEEEEHDQEGPTGLDDNGSFPLTEKDSSPA